MLPSPCACPATVRYLIRFPNVKRTLYKYIRLIHTFHISPLFRFKFPTPTEIYTYHSQNWFHNYEYRKKYVLHIYSFLGKWKSDTSSQSWQSSDHDNTGFLLNMLSRRINGKIGKTINGTTTKQCTHKVKIYSRNYFFL